MFDFLSNPIFLFCVLVFTLIALPIIWTELRLEDEKRKLHHAIIEEEERLNKYIDKQFEIAVALIQTHTHGDTDSSEAEYVDFEEIEEENIKPTKNERK